MTAEELYKRLSSIQPGAVLCTYSMEKCEQMLPLINEINELKKERDAVILAHSYVAPEIILGVADYDGDSFKLSQDATKVSAKTIVFSAVRFMGETAKILNPTKDVLIPGPLTGCSLADSITGAEVKALREKWLARHYNFDNPLSIAAAQAAYEKGDEWLEALKKYLDANFAFTKEYLSAHLPKARFAIPEATYLAWVDLSDYFAPGEDLPDFFAYKAGVLLEGGKMFVQNADGFIRLNLAMPRAMLAEGLKRICDAVSTKHNG